MEHKKYKSRYGANSDITAAQYLVEFIMERIAKKEKTTLPFKFWNIPKWNKVFRMQIKYANELLDEYSEREIFESLKTKKGQYIYSLGARKTHIIPLILELSNNRKISLPEKIKTSADKLQDCTEEWLDDKHDQSFEDVPNKETNLWSKLK